MSHVDPRLDAIAWKFFNERYDELRDDCRRLAIKLAAMRPYGSIRRRPRHAKRGK